MLFNFSFTGDAISLLLLVIMACGSFVVVTFVYIEMWDDKEGAAFAILLIFFLVFMGLLASSGNLVILYVG
jgi:NADH:ubiquinone oxidoreductase subunit 2 (subunit N)